MCPQRNLLPPKTWKKRVVFGCSAKFRGVSLNDYLLNGPDLMNGMARFLCLFRKEEAALAVDIQPMFCQLLVEEKDWDFLRFFWWKEGDISKLIVEYRMIIPYLVG